jgi:50S ribosomal subunit-associated GTPase HflX
MVVVFNKCDVADSKIPLNWLRDYDSFTEALKNKDNYLSTLSKQMVLTLEEFYNNFTVLEVSSLTGKGFEKLNEVLETAKKEYMNITLVDIQKKMAERKQSNYDKQIT